MVSPDVQGYVRTYNDMYENMSDDNDNGRDNPSAALPSRHAVAHVAIKPPPFTMKNPASFFFNLEAQFEISGRKITDHQTKFFHVVSYLPEHVMERIPNLVDPSTRPTSPDMYQMIKDHLLDTYRRPLDERLSEFVETASLGSLCPSALAYQEGDQFLVN